jgi:hypothetical protein
MVSKLAVLQTATMLLQCRLFNLHIAAGPTQNKAHSLITAASVTHALVGLLVASLV